MGFVLKMSQVMLWGFIFYGLLRCWSLDLSLLSIMMRDIPRFMEGVVHFTRLGLSISISRPTSLKLYSLLKHGCHQLLSYLNVLSWDVFTLLNRLNKKGWFGLLHTYVFIFTCQVFIKACSSLHLCLKHMSTFISKCGTLQQIRNKYCVGHSKVFSPVTRPSSFYAKK